MSNAAEKQPVVIYLYKEDRCPKCLYLNPKGEKHFACHNKIPDKNGRTNPECPAGDYLIVAGFRVELWAQRYAKAQLSGHLKNMRVIQAKLEGLDEETIVQFWSQVNLNVAIAMGVSIADEVTGDGEEGDETAESSEQSDAGGSLRLVQTGDGEGEEPPADEEEATETAAPAPQVDGGEDDWED